MQSRSFRKNAFDISPEIQGLAEMEELGELHKVYTISKQGTTLFGVGTLCTVFGVIITPFLFTPSPPPPEVAVPGLILLMVGSYLVFSRRLYSRMYSRWHIYLWQYGFIYEKNQIRQVFRWDQIDTIHRNTDPRISSCKVCRQDGYQIRLSYAFSERDELIDIVFEEFARQCAPQELIIAPPRSSRTFPYVKLDRQGIGNAQEILSWQEIQMFMTKNGTVTLLKKEE
jgi:hypothetical protein